VLQAPPAAPSPPRLRCTWGAAARAGRRGTPSPHCRRSRTATSHKSRTTTRTAWGRPGSSPATGWAPDHPQGSGRCRTACPAPAPAPAPPCPATTPSQTWFVIVRIMTAWFGYDRLITKYKSPLPAASSTRPNTSTIFHLARASTSSRGRRSSDRRGLGTAAPGPPPVPASPAIIIKIYKSGRSCTVRPAAASQATTANSSPDRSQAGAAAPEPAQLPTASLTIQIQLIT